MSDERPYISVEVRRAVFERARWLCEYCRSPEAIGTVSFQIEHIVPLVSGGSSDLLNLACSCPGCNSHKAMRVAATDPATGTTVSLFNPREQIWSEHFAWSENFTQIIGQTAAGRATIAALSLNRRGLQNLRRVLVLDGIHPPAEDSLPDSV